MAIAITNFWRLSYISDSCDTKLRIFFSSSREEVMERISKSEHFRNDCEEKSFTGKNPNKIGVGDYYREFRSKLCLLCKKEDCNCLLDDNPNRYLNILHYLLFLGEATITNLYEYYLE